MLAPISVFYTILHYGDYCLTMSTPDPILSYVHLGSIPTKRCGMAENESLDLWQPGGQRWLHVHDAVKKQQSPEEVAHKVTRKLPQALRKAFKEFAEAGVTIEQFLENRHDLKAMSRLVRKCQGHDYAHLLAETAAVESSADDRQLMTSFLIGVVERVSDQITHDVVGTSAWPDIAGVRDHFARVQVLIASDMQRISTKLAADPNWVPTVKSKPKSEAENPTKELLGMSLMGMGKK